MELVNKPLKILENDENKSIKYVISLKLKRIIKRANSYEQFIKELPDDLSTEFYKRVYDMMPNE